MSEWLDGVLYIDAVFDSSSRYRSTDTATNLTFVEACLEGLYAGLLGGAPEDHFAITEFADIEVVSECTGRSEWF